MALTFLVVDDEKLSRSYIRNMLERHDAGYSVYEASSAGMAAEIFRNTDIDVLFLDVKMPGQDGFGLLGMLPHRHFELVFITAHNEHAIKAIKEGAADYLLKPIKKTEFIATLQRVTERRMQALAQLTNTIPQQQQLSDMREQLSDYVRSIKEKNEQIEQLKNEIEQLRTLNGTVHEKIAVLDALQTSAILTEEDWNNFKDNFESVYANFFLRLREKYGGLTQAEIRLIALIKLNLTTREMAGMLGISPETIRQGRWRLRKKMQMPDEVSLEQMVAEI